MVIKMATIRKDALVTGEVYHIFTRSIAGFEVLRSPNCLERFVDILLYYNHATPGIKFSKFLELPSDIRRRISESQHAEPLVQIIAYCLMPTHPHLILKQLEDRGVSIFMNNVLNSFTRYFNISHERKGPLWESEFKNVLVDTDEQLLHLTRYIHLNPVSARLINLPEDWDYSSYREYICAKPRREICHWQDILNIHPTDYKRFVNDRASYQRNLSEIKRLLIDNYVG